MVVAGLAISLLLVDVESIVPQGLELGPWLFLLYINGLPKDLTSIAWMFAEHTLCHNTTSTPSDQQSL